MSFASRPSAKPSQSFRVLVLVGVPLMLAIGFVGSPFAQSAPGGYGPGGYGPGSYGPGGGPGIGRRGGGDHMGPPRGGDQRVPSLEAIDGPPSPATMRDSIKLGDDQLQQYSRRYGDHMAATRAMRDSLRTSVESMRSAFETGDRSAARERHQAVERQWKELSDRDKNFDKGLKDILTKDQQKRYKKWKQDRENEQQDRWRGRRSPNDREGWSSGIQLR